MPSSHVGLLSPMTTAAGLFAAGLALVGQIVLGSLVIPDDALAAQRSAINPASVLCAGSHDPSGGAPHRPRALDTALCHLASAAALAATPACAHVVAGPRVLPVTLTSDDPGVGDEALLPTFTCTRAGANGGTGPTHEVDFGFDYDETITPDTALILNDGDDVQDTEGSLYGGKGLGDLPIGLLRPLALTGELSDTIAEKELKLELASVPAASLASNPFASGLPAQFNNDNNAWSGAFSVQYSLPYLQSRVRDVGLLGWLDDMIPLVEFDWSSPSAQGTTWAAAPGVIDLTW